MMPLPTQAQIYLADYRGCSETPGLRSYHTFNFGPYYEESRQPFGSLHLVNDDTLRAGASLSMQVEKNTQVVLIPVAGGLEYGSDLLTGSPAAGSPAAGFLEPGEVGVFLLTAGMRYTVSNPYETESINFIQLWLATEPGDFSPAFTQTSFDLTRKNQLVPLFGRATIQMASRPTGKGFIGQYDGRQEESYPVTKPAGDTPAGIFIFVLKGVFEVANRLLHERDSLALAGKSTEPVEFEALSNEAILMLIELPIVHSD